VRHAVVEYVENMGFNWVRRAGPNSASNLARFAAKRPPTPRVRAAILPMTPALLVGAWLVLEAGSHDALEGAAPTVTQFREWETVASGGGPEE
jgi:hypothetical protein